MIIEPIPDNTPCDYCNRPATMTNGVDYLCSIHGRVWNRVYEEHGGECIELIVMAKVADDDL